MIFRVKLHGAGNPADPYRANLPTYTTLAVDVPGGTITVFVPAGTVGFDKAPPTAPVQSITAVGPAITGVAVPDAVMAQSTLDATYSAAPGTYTLEPK